MPIPFTFSSLAAARRRKGSRLFVAGRPALGQPPFSERPSAPLSKGSEGDGQPLPEVAAQPERSTPPCR